MALRLHTIKTIILFGCLTSYASLHPRELASFIQRLTEKVAVLSQQDKHIQLGNLKLQTLPAVFNNQMLSATNKNAIKKLDTQIANYFTVRNRWPSELFLRVGEIGKQGRTIEMGIERLGPDEPNRAEQLATLLDKLKQIKVKAALSVPFTIYPEIEKFLDDIPVSQ